MSSKVTLAVERVRGGEVVVIGLDQDRAVRAIRDVLVRLSEVMDPHFPQVSIVELGLIRNIQLINGELSVELGLTTTTCPMKGDLKSACQVVLSSLLQNTAIFRSIEVFVDEAYQYWSPSDISELGKKLLDLGDCTTYQIGQAIGRVQSTSLRGLA